MRLFLKIVVLLMIVASCLYVVQQMLAPEIDPELTQAVKVSVAAQPSGNRQPETADTPSANGSGGAGETTVGESNAILAGLTQEAIDAADHPLDPLLEAAEKALERIDETIFDYTAIMQKQVRLGKKLQPEGFMRVKIRHEHETEEGKVPFSAYTYFLKPKKLAGQEAIWVEGANDGKLCGHAHGLLNVKRFWLDPTSDLAMDGNLHPMTEIGMRNLMVLMLEKGKRDRKRKNCTVQVTRNLMVGEYPCTLVEVTHPKKHPKLFDFHIAKIYISDEFNLPVAYEGYLWPEQEGGEPLLMEKYYYSEIETNVGLQDVDFDPGNPDYNFPAW